MTTGVIGREKLDMGRVFQTTFQVIGRRFKVLLGISALLSLAPSLVMLVLMFPFFDGFTETASNPFPFAALPAFGVAFPILLLISAMHQAATLHVAITDIAGKQPTFREALITGVRRGLPVLGVLILSLLAIVAGGMFLFVPGVMIALAFSVAVPAVTAEHGGVFGAFARSRYLTRDNRWRILGMVLVYAIATWVFQLVITGLTGGFLMTAINSSMLFTRMAVSLIESFFTTILSTVGLAALYAELRRIKDGVGASDLAAVFD